MDAISIVRGIKNSAFLFFGDAFSALISFLVIIYIARVFSVSEFGSYVTVIAFVSLFAIFEDFGINTVIIREGAKNPEHTGRLIFNTMGLEVLLSVGSMAVVTACMFFVPYPLEVKILIVLTSPILLMGGLGSLFSSVFRIYQDMKYVSIVTIVERVVFAVFALAFVSLGFGVVGVIYATIIGAVVSMFLSYYKSRQIHRYKLNFKPIFDINIINPALWFGFGALLGTVWQRIDTLMISVLLDMGAVGLYTPAVNYVGVGDMAVVAVTGAFFPVLSRAVHARGITKKELFKYMLYFAVAGIVAIGMSLIFADDLIYYTVGPKFMESVSFLNVLVVGFAIGLIAIPTALLLDVTNLQKIHVLNATYMSFANIGLNLYLIPVLGAMGAAYSTTISRALGTLLGVPIAVYFLRKSQHL